MHDATQVFAAVSFLVIGLSHVLQPQVWVSWFRGLAAQGAHGAFTEGFLSLTFGSIVIAFHNVWHGPELILTLIGLGQILKGLGRFVAPQAGLRMMARMSNDRLWHIRAGGIVSLALSAFIWWLRFRR